MTDHGFQSQCRQSWSWTERFAYTLSNNLSGFNIAQNGTLTPIGGGDGIVAANPAGSTNLDIAACADGNLLYTLNSSSGTTRVWTINPNGTVQEIDSIPGLPAKSGVNGLAAF